MSRADVEGKQHRYQARLFSRKWLESKGLLGAIPRHLEKYIVLE
jgi:cysteine synthase A